MSKIKRVITEIVIELVEVNAVLNELERAFPYLDGNYYYCRKQKMEERKAEINNILLRANVEYDADAPAEQYLITEEVRKVRPTIFRIKC